MLTKGGCRVRKIQSRFMRGIFSLETALFLCDLTVYRLLECGGCEQCQGHPFGGSCVAERNKDFPSLKHRLIDEINAFGIEGLAVADLNLLTGFYVNLSYPLANGSTVQFLKDNDIYLGNQVEQADSDRCYGIVANEDFILICEYGCNGSDPEIVLCKRR